LKYNEGDKVFCFHGPLLYEGKVQKVKLKEKLPKYFVHYSGWNTKWDEWVTESRMMEYSEETIKKQKELKQQHLLSKRKGAKNLKEDKKEESPPTTAATPVLPPPSKRRKGRSSTNNDQSCIRKIEVKIVIPHDLRRYLLDDCDFVVRQKQLVPLPKPEDLTVRGILKKYEKYKEDTTSDEKTLGTVREVCSGINEYFNVMLGSQLLYKFERTQYADILKENSPSTSMCDIYGAEHLLRLFVKLGSVLPYSFLDEASMEFVVIHVHDFLEFLMKNSEDMFVAEYENSTPDYHRRCAV